MPELKFPQSLRAVLPMGSFEVESIPSGYTVKTDTVLPITTFLSAMRLLPIGRHTFECATTLRVYARVDVRSTTPYVVKIRYSNK